MAFLAFLASSNEISYINCYCSSLWCMPILFIGSFIWISMEYYHQNIPQNIPQNNLQDKTQKENPYNILASEGTEMT
ncbi:unnamed protein product [Blepharisma stoltei]|uniref:Uncharacterized protein n=1 Tax=Blepharisma stoltei TaxID=1481888 RepID=A0AAU9J270_9CILI|nr:unnamed protein product [Blepharisma stoltei]